jgi:hypothetical protein
MARVEAGFWAKLRQLEGVMSAHVGTSVGELCPDQLRSMRVRYARQASWLLGAGGPALWASVVLCKRSSSAAVDRGCWALGFVGVAAALLGATMLANPDFFIRAAIRRRVLRSDHVLAEEYASTLTSAFRHRDVGP